MKNPDSRDAGVTHKLDSDFNGGAGIRTLRLLAALCCMT
jgi:hypothetical protein